MAEKQERISVVDVSPVTHGTHDVHIEQLTEPAVNLYEKRKKIHPKSVGGLWQRVREITVWSIMGLYLALPWVEWHGRQAVLFDLPDRHFYIFGLTFWPQDFVLLSWLLIIAAFGLFFFTVLAGRVFCGYTCPQTVWTRFFMWIESFVEGDRNARLKLDAAPMSLDKFLKRFIKHALWLGLAGMTAITFVGYFAGIGQVFRGLFTFDLGFWETFWICFFTLATYMNAGWMREQVCKFMCPYARFQSVMFDADTLIVSYDEGRGEPRGRGAKSREQEIHGDCIDCGKCVQVCPVGIDIRDGLQYECITCAACIDACDEVMDKIGKPHGLVRYTTEHALEGKPTRILRPRLIGYGLVLVVMGVVFLGALVTRVPVDISISRDRNSLYRQDSNGHIENVYTLELINKGQAKHDFHISFEGPKGLELKGRTDVVLAPGEHESLPVSLSYDPFYHQIKSSDVWFIIAARDNGSIREKRKARFIAPAN